MAKVTAFSIRKDGVEVERASGNAAKVGAHWKVVADKTPAGVRVIRGGD